MNTRTTLALAILAGVPIWAVIGCAGPHTDTIAAGAEAEGGPGLNVGERVPDATLRTIDGHEVRLSSLYADGPVVVTFYRGGWCPYCNGALKAWEQKTDELEAAGARLVALTPEKPAEAAKTSEKDNLGFTVLSDTSNEAARAFRVLFTLDEDTRTKYKGYGIDLASSNASGAWQLPAPGTFLIDRGGVVRWAYADWDYTKRADPDEVIAAVRRLPSR